MLSGKGTFNNGVGQPAEPVEGRQGQGVLIPAGPSLFAEG